MTALQSIYFHGAPGSPAELTLFGPAAAEIFAPDRFLDRPALPFAAYLDALADELVERFPEASLRLIGFSAGARVALEIANRLGGRIGAIELISPAAPLQLGDFLPRMEGRAVFSLARGAPSVFPAVVRLQSLLAEILPRRVFRLVFAHPSGADAALAAEPAFEAAVTSILRRSLGAARRGYAREILDIVHPWTDILPRVTAPVRLWQGDLDNWTPPEMARALAEALPGAPALILLPGLSHYSTLREALRSLTDPA